jgi:hypothetical protein
MNYYYKAGFMGKLLPISNNLAGFWLWGQKLQPKTKFCSEP